MDGQVFASVGSGEVDVHDPTTGNLVSALQDGTGEPFTAGSSFDGAGNFLVTDDTLGEISEYNYQGTLQPTFATGLSNPLSLVYDKSGNLYVGQQSTPYIAQFDASGHRLADIGPLATQRVGDDWIDLASDQCTFYYTTEGTDILRYNKCTNTQLSNFNQTTFTGANAFEMRILPNGNVLVADSDADLLLDPSGNIIKTFSCTSLPGCGGQLFSVAIDPSAKSFWTGDTFSGDAWQVNLSSGTVMQTIDMGTAFLLGLSVHGQPSAAANVPQGGYLTAAEGYGGGAPSECACLSTNGKTGDPVNPMDGDYYSSSTDISVPGPGVPLAFTRTYDAQAAQSGETSALGPGWSDPYAMAVALDPSTNWATVTESNGAQVEFSPSNASDPWCPTSHNYCPASPRDIATLQHNADGTWTFTNNLSSTLTYGFTTSGALSTITNAAGQSVTASTEAPGTGSGASACPSSAGSCTVWASNASTPNPTLTEVFNAAGQLLQVVGYVTSGGTPPTASFCYYGLSGCPSSGGVSGSLATATDPGALTTAYTYDATNATTSYRDDLLTQLNPDEGTLTNVYNAAGQVSQQTDPSGVVTTFSYNDAAGFPLGDGPADTTTVTLTPGTGLTPQVTQYTYTYGELSATTRDPGGTGVATTDTTRSLVTGQVVSSTDPDHNTSTTALPTPASSDAYLNAVDPTSSTDALGNKTLFADTASNQVWCEVEPAEVAAGVTCPSTQPTTAPTPGSQNTVDLGATITYFDAAGNPTYVTDPLGNTTETAYTSAEEPFCKVDAVEFTTAAKFCPSSPPASPPTGTATGYTTTLYDATGNKTSVTNALGATTTYAYTNASFPNTVTKVTDPEGDVTQSTLDVAGRTTLVTEAFGAFSSSTQYGYDPGGRRFCEVQPNDYAVGIRCPSSAPTTPPTPGSDPWPGATITIFDHSGQPTSQVNPLGGVTQTAYDGTGEDYCTVTPTDYAQGITCPVPGQPWIQGITLSAYDALGRPMQVTNPLGGVTATSYDASGNVLETTIESNNPTADPNVDTQYSYDADNRVTLTTVDSGGGTHAATTDQVYDPDGNVFCSVSANAEAGGNFQCPTWQNTWIATPPNPSSLYSSTPSAAQANDVTTKFDDANGNQIQSTNPDVETTVTALDADGRTYCTADPTNLTSWLSAHSSGTYPYLCPSAPPSSPPAQGSNPGYDTTIYDAAGNTLSTTDQVGDTTSSTYNAAGQTLTTTDPRAKVTTNCYYSESASGQCAHGAPAGGVGTELFFSLAPSTGFDSWGVLTSYTYDPGGQNATTSNWAGSTTNGVGANGELTSVTYSNAAAGYASPGNVAYTYNQDDTRHTMTDTSGTTTYAYDDNADVTSQTLVAASGSGLSNATTSYGYVDTGTLATITYPSYSGHVSPQVSYSYDATGAMASETDWLGNEVTFSHDQDGNATAQNNAVSVANPSGTSSTALSYDAADQNTAATSTINQTCGGSENLTQSFAGTNGSRNPDGQLTQYKSTYSATCSGQGTNQVDYSYDPAGRVTYQGTTAQGTNPNTFGYDPSGDITTISSHATSGGTVDTYNQTYDSAGEVTGQSPVTGSGGSSSSYAYDMLGDQTQSVNGSSTSEEGFNQALQLTSASTPTGSAGYLYTGDGLEAGVTSSAGAPSWGSPSDINSTRAINAISCVSSSFCVAVGASGYATVFNGSTWSTPSDVDSTRNLDAISCTSSTFCMAVDATGYAVMYNGSSWSTPTGVDFGSNAISCTSSTFCVAVGGFGIEATYTGTWTNAVVDSSRTLDAVTCVSSSFCQAVDTAGNAIRYNGSWGSPTDIDGTRSLDTVACTSDLICVAAGASGYAATYNAFSGTWSSASDVDGSRTIKAVACTTTSFCAAVDASGFGVTFNGSSWTSATDIDGSHSLQSLSCASATLCTASDNSGNMVTYKGSSWSSPVSMDSTRSVNAIACPSVVFCMAGDGAGNAVLFQPLSTTTSQLTWDTNGSLPMVLSDGSNDYLYGPSGEPVEQIALSSSTPTYLSYSSSNDTWLATNTAGDQTGFWGYDAFGTLAFGTPASSFGYSGQHGDTTTSLVNDRARWYEPQTGGFTTRDPAFASTDTAYTYSGGDPVNEGDPSGLASKAQTLGTLAEVASVVANNPQWSDAPRFQDRLAAFLWAVAPINCGHCEGPDHRWNDFNSDTAFATASGTTGNERQSECLQGPANSSCGASPNANPWWATPRGAITIGLTATAIGSFGMSLAAEGGAATAWALVSGIATATSGAMEGNACAHHEYAECLTAGLSFISFAGSVASLFQTGELLAAYGEAVALPAGGSAGLLDVFTLSIGGGAGGTAGQNCEGVNLRREGSVRVPEPGLGWNP